MLDWTDVDLRLLTPLVDDDDDDDDLLPLCCVLPLLLFDKADVDVGDVGEVDDDDDDDLFLFSPRTSLPTRNTLFLLTILSRFGGDEDDCADDCNCSSLIFVECQSDEVCMVCADVIKRIEGGGDDDLSWWTTVADVVRR